MMERKDEFLALMKKTMEERGYTLMILMLTDVLLEGTQILYIGDEEIFAHAFNTPLKDHTCFLPGVVSQKKADHSDALGTLGLKLYRKNVVFSIKRCHPDCAQNFCA